MKKRKGWQNGKPPPGKVWCAFCCIFYDSVGVMKREGPRVVYQCPMQHINVKGLTKPKDILKEEGLILTGGMPDPRHDAKKKAAREEGWRRRQEALHGFRTKELGRAQFYR